MGLHLSSWKQLNYSDTCGSTPCSLVPLQSSPAEETDCLSASCYYSSTIYTLRLMKHRHSTIQNVFSPWLHYVIQPIFILAGALSTMKSYFFLIVCHPGLKFTYLSLMNSCHNGIWASGAVWLSFKQTNVPFLQPGSVGSEHVAFPQWMMTSWSTGVAKCHFRMSPFMCASCFHFFFFFFFVYTIVVKEDSGVFLVFERWQKNLLITMSDKAGCSQC